jgi:hypothetical protein
MYEPSSVVRRDEVKKKKVVEKVTGRRNEAEEPWRRMGTA